MPVAQDSNVPEELSFNINDLVPFESTITQNSASANVNQSKDPLCTSTFSTRKSSRSTRVPGRFADWRVLIQHLKFTLYIVQSIVYKRTWVQVQKIRLLKTFARAFVSIAGNRQNEISMKPTFFLHLRTLKNRDIICTKRFQRRIGRKLKLKHEVVIKE